MEIFRRKRSSGQSSYNKRSSPKLNRFVKESAKGQTLFANCEGSYGRRIFDVGDTDTLNRFIYFSIYYDGVHDWNEVQDLKRKQVERIQEKIVAVSRGFQLEGEIHVGVIWVYCFAQETEIQDTVPLFKIFKTKTGNEAVFLNVGLRLYDSWNDFIELAEFPVSLLCLPRNGNYDFENGNKKLALEFVCSKKLKKSMENQFVPYSQVAIRPLLFVDCSQEKIAQLKRLIKFFWENLKEHGENLVKIVLFGYSVFETVKNEGIVSALKTIDTNSLMIFDKRPKEDMCKSLIKKDLLNKSLTAFSDSRGLYSEVKHLSQLLTNVKKDWREILKTVALILCKFGSVSSLISLLGPLPPVLNNLLVWLRAFATFTEHFKADERNNFLGYKETERRLSSNETSKNTEVNNQVDVEKVLTNLPVLEKTSTDEVKQGLLLEKSSVASRSATAEVPVILGEEGNYGIFLMGNASVPALTYNLRLMYGRDFRLEPREFFLHDVVGYSGEYLGTVFFPREFTAFACLSLENIKESSIQR